MMFKSEEHRVGYQNLKSDYQAILEVSGKLQTRLSEKAYDGLIERFWDEIQYCLVDGWFERPGVQKRVENDEWAGSLDGVINVVDQYIWFSRVPRYLVDAYRGTYEDEAQEEFSRSPDGAGNFAITYGEWLEEWLMTKILGDNPREHLRVYLEWEGVVGYTDHILNIVVDFPLTQN